MKVAFVCVVQTGGFSVRAGIAKKNPTFPHAIDRFNDLTGDLNVRREIP
jgi:hypothetical protein